MAETGDLGSVDDLPEVTRPELRNLGIYDLFDPAGASREAVVDSTAPAAAAEK